ncbi:MAG: hypothetical protein QF632_03240 [Candidatus Woesearchaeota archaeon]|jgi:hypothetical protein|nr:hypothetical protein [Candidatus Woesearchaeota archaeon]MDP7323750.1 hypothetical protein [Candidatus Woesearchaeota archaeon]MDP7457488.1 hypothetical protein [Candidatus Woesearchaeota archaeon]|tara:strand:- start:300 stop:530 length:231 start_codon:yes stop_codon:yes gene_type:complete
MNKFWFKPKKYGYGATPSSWEGWLVTGVFILVVLWRALVLEGVQRLYLEIFVMVVILIQIVKVKTDGVWKWRWGNK